MTTQPPRRYTRLAIALVVAAVIVSAAILYSSSFQTTDTSTSTAISTTTVTQTITTTINSINGTLIAKISIGPTNPVCNANSTVGPAPSGYGSIAVVISSSGSNVTNLPVHWLSNGCFVYGSVQVALASGAYSLNLSSCTFMGCKYALPLGFNISSNQQTSLDVSIDTGIR